MVCTYLRGETYSMPAAEIHPEIPDVIFSCFGTSDSHFDYPPSRIRWDSAAPEFYSRAREGRPGARNHHEEDVRSLHHWMFAKNMSDNSPDDLGGVGDV